MNGLGSTFSFGRRPTFITVEFLIPGAQVQDLSITPVLLFPSELNRIFVLNQVVYNVINGPGYNMPAANETIGIYRNAFGGPPYAVYSDPAGSGSGLLLANIFYTMVCNFDYGNGDFSNPYSNGIDLFLDTSIQPDPGAGDLQIFCLGNYYYF